MSQKDILERVVDLSRLGPFSADKHERLKKEFERILDLFKVLEDLPKSADTKTQGPATPWRDDVTRISGARDKILANFPSKEGALLKVPKVIE